MDPEQHGALQEWGEQRCAACGHDQAAHITPRRQDVCADFTPEAAAPDDAQ